MASLKPWRPLATGIQLARSSDSKTTRLQRYRKKKIHNAARLLRWAKRYLQFLKSSACSPENGCFHECREGDWSLCRVMPHQSPFNLLLTGDFLTARSAWTLFSSLRSRRCFVLASFSDCAVSFYSQLAEVARPEIVQKTTPKFASEFSHTFL
jgi:hypothetical protein